MGERGVKICGELNYRVLTPTTTMFSLKNFKNAVDFNSEEKLPCKNSWYQDVKSTHIRNKRLLDSPFTRPNCCSYIYNSINDRQKLKKLKRYGLTRPVRTVEFSLKKEEVIPCQPEQETTCHERKRIFVPECYVLSESDSDSEDDEYKLCESGSESECSGCSTLGGGTRKRFHKIIKKGWRDLLHKVEEQVCKDLVNDLLRRYRQLKDLD